MYEFKTIANYKWQKNYIIEKFYTRILKIYKNSLKDIVFVINCCWQLKRFSYSIVIVNKYFLPSTKTILVIVISGKGTPSAVSSTPRRKDADGGLIALDATFARHTKGLIHCSGAAANETKTPSCN